MIFDKPRVSGSQRSQREATIVTEEAACSTGHMPRQMQQTAFVQLNPPPDEGDRRYILPGKKKKEFVIE